MRLSDFLRTLPERAFEISADVFVETCQAAHQSIVEGSVVTGAPGQPVGQYGPGYHAGKIGGELKSSWQLVFVSPTRAHIGTNVPYAASIEDGVSYAHGGSPMTQRSTVGGFHSVQLTILGLQPLAEAALAARQATQQATQQRSGR